ncbi:hypothetical protein LMG23994_00901 [Cupriavidus pinatubonensis]|uniref:HTH araC/xylS-type domain-containing protein n=2 Tax=Cupriavidus pinatubonensis TaxID=248026 RepID=A0ABM8WFK7_9BURK|nr:hypothetical protein LMG23994_00901 [Cupriavidus pinatubonensis]
MADTIHAANHVSGNRYATSAVVRCYCSIAEQHGIGEAEFLARTGIQRLDLEGKHGLVSGEAYLRTLHLFDTLGIVPFLDPGGFDGLYSFFPDLVIMLANSSTLRDALRKFVSYRPVRGTVDRLVLKEDADQVMLVYEKTDSHKLSSASGFGTFILASKIAAHYSSCSRMSVQIDLQGRLPGRAGSRLSFADCRVRSDQAKNTWLLIGSALDQPFESFNPHVEHYARQSLNRQIQEINASFSLAHKVEVRILQVLRAAASRFDDESVLALLCESMGMSRWTLRRHLGLEGRTFSQLLVEARCTEMRHLLAHSDLSIAEIGDQLGFATPGSLTRFTRRHLGVTPSDYRRRLVTMPNPPGRIG